ncbi:MAG: glycosyltransferase family 4 protein [Methylotenera sp.]|nr:glycosyltransferase family 4 protein [Methylotenera sp.]
MVSRKLTVLQVLPELNGGGVELETLDVAKFLAGSGCRSIVMSAGGRMEAQLEADGSEHVAWSVGKKSLWTLRLIWQLRKFLIEQKVDIIHARSRLPAWIAYLAWRGMDVKTRPRFVTTVHGAYSPSRYSAVMVKGERVIAISQTIQSYITKNYPDVALDNIRFIYRGIDEARFFYGYQPSVQWLESWRSQYPQLINKTVLTIPGRISRRKGLEDFIQLIARLKMAGTSVHGLVVGEAHPHKQEFLHELHRLVKDLELEGEITFIGHRADVREVIAVSNIVCSLSTEPEAFGRTTIEALSLGVPDVGYDIGGVGEQLAILLPEGRVPLGDVVALQNVVMQWIQHAPVVPKAHPFLLKNMLQKTMAVYQELTSSHE